MGLRILTLMILALPVPALAYLDPGTGSMLLQVILGGIAAVAVAVKLFWYRILAVFGIKKTIDENGGGGSGSTGQDPGQTEKQNTGGGGGWD